MLPRTSTTTTALFVVCAALAQTATRGFVLVAPGPNALARPLRAATRDAEITTAFESVKAAAAGFAEGSSEREVAEKIVTKLATCVVS